MTDILDTIDGALDDYAMSADAMRWSPEPEEARVSQPILPAELWERCFRGETSGYGGEVQRVRWGDPQPRTMAEMEAAALDLSVHFRRITVDIQPFINAMHRSLEMIYQFADIPTWLTTPAPPELTNDTLRLLTEAPRDATIATTIETACSDEPIPIVMQPPEATMPESPKVQAAIDRWSDEGRRR